MSAYIVFIRDKMLNAEQYHDYLQKAAPTLALYQGEILVLNGENEALEGDSIDGSVVLKFPNMALAKAWYESDEYCQFKDLRLTATEGRAVLLNGFS